MAGIAVTTSSLGICNQGSIPNPPPFVTKVNDTVSLSIAGAKPSTFAWGLSAAAAPGLVPSGGGASSAATLSSTTAPNPTFSTDAPGRFLISCVADNVFYQATLVVQ